MPKKATTEERRPRYNTAVQTSLCCSKARIGVGVRRFWASKKARPPKKMAPAHIMTKVSSTGRNCCDNQRERIVKMAAERTAPNKATRPRVWPEVESLPPPRTIKPTPKTEVKIEAAWRG